MPIGTYTPPPPGKSITQFFFHFRCILLQISHQKCFFISISIPGRSGVKNFLVLLATLCSVYIVKFIVKFTRCVVLCL